MARKKPISVHVTEEEKAQFHEAMLEDDMVDLGPWIAKVVRHYIKNQQTLRDEVADMRDVLGSVELKTDSIEGLVDRLVTLTGETLLRVAHDPDDREQVEKMIDRRR